MSVVLAKRYRDHLESRLASIWESVLDLDVVMPDQNFLELGGDSVRALVVCARVKAEFGIRLNVNDLLRMPTVGELAMALRTRAQAPTAPVVEIASSGDRTRPPLYFVHGASGEVMFLSDIRPETFSRNVYGLRSHGLNLEVEPVGTVEEMADHYVQEILARSGTAPIMVAGYSAGGVIAYEIACRLVNLGVPVPYLGLIDPSVPGDVTAHATDTIQSLMQERLDFLLKIYRLPSSWRDNVQAVTALRDVGGIPADYSAALFERTLEVWALNTLATRRYKPSPLFRRKAFLYMSASDTEEPRATPGEVNLARNRHAAAWDTLLAPESTTWHSTEGHFEIMRDPRLYPRMRGDMDSALRRRATG